MQLVQRMKRRVDRILVASMAVLLVIPTTPAAAEPKSRSLADDSRNVGVSVR